MLFIVNICSNLIHVSSALTEMLLPFFIPCLFLLCFVHDTGASKILMMPMVSGRPTSHRQAMEKIAMYLKESGHNVTWLLGEEYPAKDGFNAIYYKSKTENYAEFARSDSRQSPLTMLTSVMQQVTYHCQPLLQNKVVMARLREENFDLMFLDTLWDMCSFVVADFIQKPYASFNGAGPMGYLTSAWEGPRTVSWMPMPVNPYSQRMNFRERLINTVAFMSFSGVYH